MNCAIIAVIRNTTKSRRVVNRASYYIPENDEKKAPTLKSKYCSAVDRGLLGGKSIEQCRITVKMIAKPRIISMSLFLAVSRVRSFINACHFLE
jgi:hypothetical protein